MAQRRKRHDVRRGQVGPVEAVQVRLPGTFRTDNALPDKPVQGVADALFRMAPSHLVYLPAGELGFGAGQHCEHISVDSRRHECQRPA